MAECYVQCSHCGAKVSNVVESSIPEGLIVRAFVECVDCVAKSQEVCPECEKKITHPRVVDRSGYLNKPPDNYHM